MKRVNVIQRYEIPFSVDIRELIGLSDAMDDEELKFGPNGGLVFCMEFLLENMVILIFNLPIHLLLLLTL